MMKDIFILGIGMGTPQFIELAEICGYNIVGLYVSTQFRAIK